MKPLYTA